MSLNRRNFIAGSAAMASTPALGAVSASGEVDVAIVGAGAAGIAAARKVAAAGRRYVLLEASDRIGGRCLTDTTTFGVPYDRGAHWLHVPEINPLAKLAPRGFEVYPAPPGQKLRIGKRNAREGEMEDYLSTVVRANRAIQDAARGKTDVNCMQALPKDLGEWRPAVEFFLGPFGCGKNLDEISAVDFARSVERDVDCVLPSGLRRAGGEARLGADRPAQGAGHAHAIDAQFRRDGCRARLHQGARRDRHGVERRARRRQDQVHARAAEAPYRCDREADARLLRSCGAGAEGQSAAAAQRRSGVREGDRARKPQRCWRMSPARRSRWSSLPASSARSSPRPAKPR